jgi:hypothetical protein
VIVLRPELENWVWSNSPHVEEVLGWSGHAPDLREWLRNQHLWPIELMKPGRPKEAMEAALREVGLPRSSALFRRLAEEVSLNGCSDPAFLEFRAVMQRWFPAIPKT